MYKFFQQNQKKLLAIFGVLLMIVFILPSTFKGGSGRTDVLVGRAAGSKIYASDEAQAKQDLQDLRQISFLPLENLGNRQVRPQMVERPLLYVLLQREADRDGIQVSEQAIEDAFKQAAATPEQQEQLKPAVERFLKVRAAYERAASGIKVTSPLIRYALAKHDTSVAQSSGVQGVRLNLVDLTADQFLNRVPSPTPEQIRQQYDLAANRNPTPSTPGYRLPGRFKIQYLELPAEAVVDSFLKTLTGTPAAYQLDLAGYNYYQANSFDFQTPVEPPPATQPTTNPATNPTITPTTGPAGPTTDAALAPATQPATGPATAVASATTAPTSAPATRTAASQPTTRPFEEVKVDIRRRLLLGSATSDARAVKDLKPKFDAYAKGLRDELRNQMEFDYRAWAARTGADVGGPTTSPATLPAAGPTTAPTTALTTAGPTTGPSPTLPIPPGVAYDSYEYLEALATAFQQRHGIRPLPVSLANKWWTGPELIRPSPEDAKALGRINQASANGNPFGFAVTLQVQLTTRPASTTSPSAAPTTGPSTTQPATGPTTAPMVDVLDSVKLFKPSDVLKDFGENAFVFRISGFDPAHAPPLAEVETAIVKDLKAAAAAEMVKSAAQKMVTLTDAMNQGAKAGNKTTTGALVSAARTEFLDPLEVGPIARPEQAPTLIPILQARGRQILDLFQRDRANAQAYFGQFQEVQSELARLTTIDGFPAFNQWPLTTKLDFLRQAAALAAKATPADPHPVVLIDIPAVNHTLVAELAQFEFDWPKEQADRGRLRWAHMFEAEMEAQFAEDWFNFDHVAKRVGYEPAEKDKKSD